MSNPTMNREGWLTAFAEAIAPVIKQRTGHDVPMDKTRLTCGFPRTRATPSRKTGKVTTGQCIMGHKSGLNEIMINPIRDTIIAVNKDGEGHGIGETIVHELLHASLEQGVGHKAPFARAAKKMDLGGKPTETFAGPELVKIIEGIAEKLGPYPHKAIDADWGTKQTTRLLKVQCVDCGYINEAGNGYTARITLTWIENAGLPTCPCGATMSLIEKGEEANIVALKPVESSAHYQVPGEDGGVDERFQIRRTSSERHGDRWNVLDFGEEKWGTSTPRVTAAESKTDALNVITAIREGLYTQDYLEDEQGWDEGEDDGSNPLADDDPDLDALLFIPDDEDEDPEHPEDQQPESHVLRKRFNGQWREVEVDFDYDEVAASRE